MPQRMDSVLMRILVGMTLIAAVVLLLSADWLLEHLGWPGPPWPVRPLKGLPLTVLIVLLIPVAHRELAKLCSAAGVPILAAAPVLGAVAIASMPFWRQAVPAGAGAGEATLSLVLGGVLLLAFGEQIVRFGTQWAVRRVGGSMLAVCYLGICAGLALDIRVRFGVGAFVLFLGVVKTTDIGAYFVGRAVGRHKLIPSVSPGKSWEGLVGGLAVGVLCAMAVGGTFHRYGGDEGGRMMVYWKAAVFGLVTGLFGQVADLCESALKRDAGAKDSGRAVPAFGGVLDVMDSPLLAAPVGYLLLAVLL